MGKTFLFPLFFLWTLVVQGQDVKPAFEVLEFDLIARTKPRLDLNEIPCAVLRISAADIKGYVFEGNIIGDIEFSPGEALIYMTNNSRRITIKSDLFGVINYEFPERLRKQVVYKLSLKVEEPEETYREKELAKVTKQVSRQLRKKATKTARQEAKQLKKGGWKNAPGGMPIDKQLDKSYTMQLQYDGDFESRYLMAQGVSSARTYDAARVSAEHAAKVQLAGMIESTITSETENAVVNKLLSQEEAASIVDMVQKSRVQVLQQIGKVELVMELYRDTSLGKEVLVRIAYDTNRSKKAAIETIRNELNLSHDWGKKLGDILGLQGM